MGFFPLPASILALGLTQPPIEWISRTLTSGVRRPRRETDHSPTPKGKDKVVPVLF
jgi:hypothetical protein